MLDVKTPEAAVPPVDTESSGFVRGLGLFDSTTIVVGSMIGSGIFIVSADIARRTGSTGSLLAAWIITGLMTVAAALSYGELAALKPKAGGQYIYLREAYSPLWGFLYGWTLFLVIQTGTIAAVAVGFARFLGVVWPAVSPNGWIVPPIKLSSGYAISLSLQQLVALLLILLLTALNTRGLKLGKLIQNVFTSAKTLGLAALILAGVFLGRNAEAIHANFSGIWTLHDPQVIEPGAGWMKSFIPAVTAASGVFGLLIAYGVGQVGSLFSADAWNNITFTAGEVKNPKRHPDFTRGGHGNCHHAVFPREPGISFHAHAPSNSNSAGRSSRDGHAARHLWKQRRDADGAGDHGLDVRLREWIDLGGRAGVLRDGTGQVIFSKHRAAQCQSRSRHGACPSRNLGGDPGVAADPARELVYGRSDLRESLWSVARLRHFRGADFLHPNYWRPLRVAKKAPERRPPVPRVGISGRPGSVHRDGVEHHGGSDPVPDAGYVAGPRDCSSGRTCILGLVEAVRSAGLN